MLPLVDFIAARGVLYAELIGGIFPNPSENWTRIMAHYFSKIIENESFLSILSVSFLYRTYGIYGYMVTIFHQNVFLTPAKKYMAEFCLSCV